MLKQTDIFAASLRAAHMHLDNQMQLLFCCEKGQVFDSFIVLAACRAFVKGGERK